MQGFGKYTADANAMITAKDKIPLLDELRLGMTEKEVESLLGPPAEKNQVYKGVKKVRRFGSFYSLQYPAIGVHIHVRKKRDADKAVLSGEKLYIKKVCGHHRVASIHNTSGEIHGDFKVHTTGDGISIKWTDY